MPKKKPQFKIESYGRYSAWKKGSRELPKILEFTDVIKAVEGNEFGMILKITGGRGIRLDYCIKHPPFRDAKGNIEPDFTGEYFVHSNQHEFYLGDCIWLPLEDKTGKWEIIVYFMGKEVARKQFDVVLPEEL